jgi:hypothetical protein
MFGYLKSESDYSPKQVSNSSDPKPTLTKIRILPYKKRNKELSKR